MKLHRKAAKSFPAPGVKPQAAPQMAVLGFYTVDCIPVELFRVELCQVELLRLFRHKSLFKSGSPYPGSRFLQLQPLRGYRPNTNARILSAS